MRTPHLALLPLALAAAFASAQTAPPSAFVAPGSIQPATHFDPEHPCALPTICDTFGAPSNHPALSFSLKPSHNSAFVIAPGTLTGSLASTGIPPICYKLRAYEYTVVNPNTGRIRWTGTTTCQAASSFRMKDATLHTQPSLTR
jgi:hypothetical protein